MATAKSKTDQGTVALIEQATTKAQEFEGITTDVLASAERFEITAPEQYVESGGLLKEIKTKQTALETLRKSMTQPLDEAKRRIMELFRPASDKLDQAERTLKSAMITYTNEQERLRREAEQAAREEAARESDRLMKQADRARAKGQDGKAADLEEQAESVPVPIVASQTPIVSGVAFRTTWHAEVYDLELLVLACATGKAPLALLQPNMVILNTQARSLKKELNIPGVRAVPDEGMAARGQ